MATPKGMKNITTSLTEEEAAELKSALAHGQQNQLGALFWRNILKYIRNNNKEAYHRWLYNDMDLLLSGESKLEE